MIHDNLAFVFRYKSNVCLNKPIYLAASVLDYAKTYMYHTYYTLLPSLQFNKMELIYTDTDSILIKVANTMSECIEKMLANAHLFDFSNLPSTHTLANNSYYIANRRRIGCLKLETADYTISESVALAPKMYSLLLQHPTAANMNTKKCKGIPRSRVDNAFTHQMYRDAIHHGTGEPVTFKKITSKRHCVTTQTHVKAGLLGLDTKRYFTDNPREMSTAFGNYELDSTDLSSSTEGV